MTTQEIAESRKICARATEILHRLCQPGERLRMSIPVRETDDDVVLAKSLTALPAALDALEALQKRWDALNTDPEHYLKVLQRTRLDLVAANERLEKAREELRGWIQVYGSTFKVGYRHCDGQPCPCMLCTTRAALGGELDMDCAGRCGRLSSVRGNHASFYCEAE